MKYRPEIDGLRALAVIPVVLFHSGFWNGLPDVQWVEKSDLFCNFKNEECSLLRNGNKAPILDKNHLTINGLLVYNEFLNNEINIIN